MALKKGHSKAPLAMKELVLPRRNMADDMTEGFIKMVVDMLTEVLNAQDEKNKVPNKDDHAKHISASRITRKWVEKAKLSEFTTQLVDMHKLTNNHW